VDNIHKSVLLKESIDGLDIHEGDIYLDGTLGSGGHAIYALEKAHGNIIIIGLDKDKEALARSRNNFAKNNLEDSNSREWLEKKERENNSKNKIFLKQASYADLDKVLDELSIKKVNKIMLDLGISSDQFETSGRGFTFKKDEPLLMTFERDVKPDDLTAQYIVNKWQESSIADIIYGYGEEKYARRIAKAIVSYRKKKTIETTNELVEIINQAVPAFYKIGRIHPATRTFQALRIAVNDELNTLKEGLKKGYDRLEKGGRMAVISFHSLEDRIVKNFYKEKAEHKDLDKESTISKGETSPAKILTKKPITASEEEERNNPRSRSAKLRILEKTE